MTNIEDINYFIGVDISKKTLDVAVLYKNRFLFQESIANSPRSLRSLRPVLSKLGVDMEGCIVCAEFTGIYSRHLMDFCSMYGLNLWMENALHIKRSQGFRRGKSDRVDAGRIANYAFRNRYDYKAFEEPREVIGELRVLIGQRKRLINVKKQLKMAMSENGFRTKTENVIMKSFSTGTMRALKKDLEALDKEIGRLVRSDRELRRLHGIAVSVDGVGPVTAVNMIVMTNEFKGITEARKFSCYAGVVPFTYTSGTSVNSRARVSKMANQQMKTLLHMAAMSSIRIKGEMQRYYLRKVEEGKNKMSIINAIRNKIVLRVFACIKDNRLYQKNYEYKLS